MTALAQPKQKRVTNTQHLARVRALPCCGCGQHTGEWQRAFDIRHAELLAKRAA